MGKAKTQTTKTTSKRKTPFRDVADLEKGITKFMNIHKVEISKHAKRISDYFEMCCFNYVVRFYKSKGYDVFIENLQDGKYKYKCSAQGNQENFSNFKISKTIRSVTHGFGVYHNLAVQSYHQEDIYTTPDISVIWYGTIEIDENHYQGSKKLYFASNQNLVTFCEVKQFPPFPELMFNFIGTVNEIMHSIIENRNPTFIPIQLAPSLLVSGKPNTHAIKIKESLEKRYCVNIIYDLFAPFGHVFTKYQIGYLRTIKRRQELTNIEIDNIQTELAF